MNEDERLNIEGVPDHGYIDASELLLTPDNISNFSIDADGDRHFIDTDAGGAFYRMNNNNEYSSLVRELGEFESRALRHSAWWDTIERPMIHHENLGSDKAMVIESFNKKCENCDKEDCVVINCFMEFLFDNYHVIRK